MGVNLKLKDNALLSKTNFAELDYIIATGDCNVNLGSLIRESQYVYDRIEATLEVVSNGDTPSDIFYAYVSRYYYLRCDSNSNTSFKALWGSSAESYQSSVSFNGKVNILIGQTSATPKIVVNDVTTNLSAKTNGTNAAALYILKGSATTKVWNIKVYLSNVLVRDLIPRISYENEHLGEVALYDTVNSKFYYSSSTGSFTTPTDAIRESITTAYVKGCPNISGINILKTCPNLTRVRLDIGNVSGSIDELLSYTSLSGFNDNYESQVKPRLIGTWNITGWYVSEQLSQAQAAFDGLTIIADPNYLIDFDELAVQTLDSNKPNYNPAVAIILNNNSQGITLNSPAVSGQEGRWFLTKTAAAAITSIGTWFNDKTNATDTAGIASSIGAVYSDIRFNEFRYFTGVTALAQSAFEYSRILEIKLPNTITTLGTRTFLSTKYGLNITVPSGVTSIPAYVFGNFPAGLTKPFITLLGNVTSIAEMSFYSSLSPTKPLYIHFNGNTAPPTVPTSTTDFLRGVVKVYFGDGSSEAHDNDIKASCYGYAMWRGKISKIDTWYNYAIPKLSYQNGQVTITVTRPSTIYYTIDGSVPTEDSTVYTEPFTWNGVGVIKTIAVSDEGDIFNTVNGLDFYANTVSNPIITYTSTEITIIAEQGATIYYTLDGTCPNEDSEVYTEPIAVTGDIVKVRCFARVEGKNDSEVVGKICVLDDSIWGTDGDSSYFAVQCIDSTKPNYNPAVCILLFLNGLASDYCISGGCYLSKQGALSKTSKDLKTVFVDKTIVSDSLCVVSNNPSATYDFETFNEFKYFGAFPNPDSNTDSSNCGFMNCTKLREITLPPINNLSITPSGWARNAFSGCSKLETINNLEYVNSFPNGFASECLLLKNFTLSTNITTIGNGAFHNVAKNATIASNDYIELNLPNLTTLEKAAFCSCKVIRKIINLGSITKLELQPNYYGTFHNSPIIEATLPSTITEIQNYNFYAISANAVIHLLSTTPPTISNTSAVFNPASVKLYVGDGSSASNDDAILQTYLADTKWATFSSRLDTWYNYLHPTT